MKELIKKALRVFGLEVHRYQKEGTGFDDRVITLRARSDHKGDVLLAFILDPFVSERGLSISPAHTHHWESFQIAQIFLDLGYTVDAIDFRNHEFIPSKEYAFFVSARTNLQTIGQRLNSNCIKIVHLDTAHWLFNNAAAYERALELQRRRGVSIKSIGLKLVEPHLAIEHADYATAIGNEFAMSTYRYANKPIFRTPISSLTTYPWRDDKNYEEARFSFLWFGSSGLVHKGLDLVLEAFSELPRFHLYVCGPIEDEADFSCAYHKELYETENIHTIGWVDVEGEPFKEINQKCLGIVFPSCSEGGAGSVVQCMHAGLIPIVSYESSVDVHDFGVILENCSIDEIRNSIENISKLPPEELKLMSRKTWEFARANHTRERFAAEYQRVIKQIIGERSNVKKADCPKGSN